MTDFAIRNDIGLVQELAGLTLDQLAQGCGISRMTLSRWSGAQTEPDMESLEAFYGFAFSNGIRLNKIKAQLYREDFEPKGLVPLFHGSKEGLDGAPSLTHGRDRCDFGRGFYCGTDYEQPAMFVSSFPNASLYVGVLDTSKLEVAHFSIERDWMLAVSWFRGKLDAYRDHPLVQTIRERIEAADCVVAPIADNRMFEIIDSFAEGELTDVQCCHCLSATDLGKQFVLRTERALDALALVERYYLCAEEKKALLANKEESARVGRDKVKAARRQYRNEGLYVEELLA